MPADVAQLAPASGGRKPAVVEPTRRPGFLVVHPRYRAWLAKCGVTTAADALALPGEVVSGHPARHVVRVELSSGAGRRVVFLKREHVVGWRVRLRNAAAGFGRVSRSEREAACLRRLEERGLPGPQWLAYGEDGAGRAFLLVDALCGASELRAALSDTRPSADDRRELAARLGRAVAELHDAGFDTPDLSAKHVFVRPGAAEPTLIDWQSARHGSAVPVAARVRALAALDASTADALAGPRERLRVLWAYRRSVRWPGGRPRFAELARAVRTAAAAIGGKSSIRDQRAAAGPAQRLIWLTGGEAVCVRPDVAPDWPSPPESEPYYPAAGERVPDGDTRTIAVPGGGDAMLVRFRGPAVPGWVERLTGRPWRSAGVRLARVFFQLERYGAPVPGLLAFGQRRAGPVSGESFVLYASERATRSLTDVLGESIPPADRRRLLFAAGAALRAAHDAGSRPASPARLAAIVRITADPDLPRVTLDPAAGLRKVRRVRPVGRDRDLHGLAAAVRPVTTRTDRLRLLAGYYAGDPAARDQVRAAARRILGGRAAR